MYICTHKCLLTCMQTCTYTHYTHMKVEKQEAKRDKSNGHLAFSFLYSLGSQPMEWCHSQWAGLPPAISLIYTVSHRGALGFISKATHNPVKLTD